MVLPSPFGDLNLEYPFPGGDGYDWIANGLAIAGEPVRWSGRPPLLPLAIALLYRLGLLDWLPLLLLAAFATLVVVAARLAVGGGSRARMRTACLVAFFALGACFAGQGLEVMADVLSSAFAAAAMLVGTRPRRQPASLPVAGFLCGCAGLTQLAGLSAAAGLFAAWWLLDRAAPKGRAHWIALGLAFAPPLFFHLVRAQVLGTSGDVAYRHETLLGWHPGQLEFYARAVLSILGLPAAVLVCIGLGWLAATGQFRERRRLVVLVSAACVLTFFGLFYGFTSARFLIYALPLLAMSLDAGLEAVAGRLGKTAAVLAALAALATVSIPPASAQTVVFWPFPVGELDGDTWKMGSASLADRIHQHPWWRLGAALSSDHHELKLDPQDFRAAEAVVYLYDPARSDVNFFDGALRLGNAVGRRGRAFPLSALPAEFFRSGTWSELTVRYGYRLFSFRPTGAGASWVVGFDARDVPGELSSGLPVEPLAAPTVLSALEAARCVDAELSYHDSPMVLFEDEESLASSLVAFTTSSGTLLVVPEAGARLWRQRARDQAGEWRSCGELAARRFRWQGIDYAVATTPQSLDSASAE